MFECFHCGAKPFESAEEVQRHEREECPGNPRSNANQEWEES
jgi:hypothetical protein